MVTAPAGPACRLPLVLAVVTGLLATVGAAGAVETVAPRAFILEVDTGSLLFAKDMDTPFAPGNFTKLVTAAVVFEALAAGEITDDTTYTVSNHAWKTGGAPARVTAMFAAVRSKVRVGDLLKGLAIHYGNDAAIVLAEGLAGTETAFAQRMNALAARFGMKDSRFVNPTGFADARARITLTDLERLVRHLQTTYPDRYALYSIADFEWNRIRQRNKTDFVRVVPGVDGLVSAYEKGAGFGAVVSAVRDGRRIVVAAGGLKSADDRDQEIRRLLDAAYGDYSLELLYPAGEVVGTVRVFGGAETRVPVTGNGPVAVTLPRQGREGFKARLAYNGPVPAPIRKGDVVAAVEVSLDGRFYQAVPLVAAADVPVGSLTDRARDGLSELLLGWW